MSDQPPPRRETTLHTSQAKVALLRQAQTYPEPPGQVAVVETHMSWVFLTDRYAYKLKKPVQYPFLDFSTLAARRHNCLEEVRLNRRLAREVYLGVVPLALDAAGNVGLERAGEPLDWLVKMRRLPAQRMLDELIRQKSVTVAELRRLARLLCAFYRRCPAVRIDSATYRARLAADIEENRRKLLDPACQLPSRQIATIHAAQLALLSREPLLFDRRVAEHRIVEGHGDLRPEHICMEAEPVVIDCLEFNRQFRIVDSVDELAFLALECERLGAALVHDMLFAAGRQELQDDPPARLVNFYKTWRACLRARLAIWHTHDVDAAEWPKWRRRAAVYLRLAEHYSQALA